MYYIYQFYNTIGKLLYIGKTTNLNQRFFAHFSEANWKPKETDKIMYAECKTKTDMDIYEIYYINKLKPKYNISLVNLDAPSFQLEELCFEEYFKGVNLENKNNKKINNTHNNTLNLTDKRFLEMAIDKIKNNKDNTYKYYVVEIKNKEYVKKFKRKINFNFFENIVYNLKQKYITINHKKHNYIKYGYHENGTTILIFENIVMNYLIENPIFYKIKNTINNEIIKNKYSSILYNIIIHTKKSIYSIKELRELFKIQKEYEDYYDLKRRVLFPSIKEINNKTNIDIKMEEIKDGRTIISIKFIVKYKNNEQEII